ncbi:MAG: translation elongation factor Ts [Acidimicrobiia bacterium]
MAEISAKDVAALRKATGAGMMDCKKALEASAGDMEAAKDWLRTKGLAGSGKRAGRTADNGAVDVLIDGNVAALVELTAETDFVAKGGDFTGFLSDLVAQVAKEGEGIAANPFVGDASLTVAEAITQLGAKLGEKIELGRVARYESAGVVDAYKHVQNDRGTIGVLVELTGVDASDTNAKELAHDLALHIASAAPRYLTRDDVPGDVIERERAVFEELTRNEGKPEQAIPKIVEGRLGGFYRDVCLVEQGFIKDPKVPVSKLVAELGGGATISRFARVKIGED